MAGVFLKLLKVLLLAALAVLFILVIFGLVLAFAWPWWTGVFFLAGLVGTAAGILLLKKLLLRRREKRFVNQVIAQDEAHIQTLNEKERRHCKELQERWKEAVQTLRKSHLRKYGNPLYVLPWYMVVGESGSGKTTAITSARLSSPFAEISSTSGVSGTKNCDWWFFDNAILIDTAGRYTVPVDERRDTEEWQRFLVNLARFRKREPLNGLVVTVAADKLLEAGGEALEASGKRVRRRIEELMRVLGARFPIYVLVTKCDLIRGMTRFCEHLDSDALSQAMGALNQAAARDAAGFLEDALTRVRDRLKDLRLLLLQETGSRQPDPALLLFAEEFEKIGPGLHTFVRSAFQETPYQESPILRGVFFSSGRQEGAPYSHFLMELGLIEQQEVLPGTSKGLFLHDFFSRILPGDRDLFVPTMRALQWRRLTRNLGLTAWLALAVAACGMLSFSFVKNLSAIREISREFQKPIVFENDLIADTITMATYLDAIRRVEAKNEGFRIPRLGLKESMEVEADLKQNFCRYYASGFLKPFDRHIGAAMARFSAETRRETLGAHVSHLVRRIHLIQGRLESENFERHASVRPDFHRLIPGAAERATIPDIDEKLADLYRYYVQWEPDTALLNEEMNNLQKWLKRMISLEETSLVWLVATVNSDISIKPYLMSDFWGGVPDAHRVAAAYTAEGRERIAEFISEIEDALYDPLLLAEKKLDFYQWYDRQYIRSWHEFARLFPQGVRMLQGRQRWERIVSKAGSDQDPYFVFMEVLADNLEPYRAAQTPPALVDLVYAFEAARLEAALKGKKNAAGKAGLVRKATRKVASALRRVDRSAGTDLDGALDTEKRLLAGEAFSDYRSALTELIVLLGSRKSAYETAALFYRNPEASGTEGNLFSRAYTHARALESLLSDPGGDLGVMKDLIRGSVDFLHQFALRETACHMQQQWEEQVLMEVRGLAAQEVNSLLMGENGKARHFVEGAAAPFIERSLTKGYYPAALEDQAVAFAPGFFTYLNRAETAAKTARSSYQVVVRAEPTGVNPGARMPPHETVTNLLCPGGGTELVNQNYPVSKSFRYSPQECRDLLLTIKIGNLELQKAYRGSLAFPRFIRDFASGSRRLMAAEFPEQEAALKRMGIDYIAMEYEFKRHKPVLDFFRAAVAPLPEVIAPCWD